MKKAVIYARYSSHNQRDESIEGQLRECQDYAEKNGYIIIGEYCDRAISGKTDSRTAFQRMIKDAKSHKFECVLVYKLDRFARNRYDSAMYKNMLKKHDVKVISVMENISDSPEGIILESVLEGMAEYYSANLSQNIKRGMTENALQGKYNGGGCPIGYKISEDKHFEIDEMGAKIVKEVFDMYADGKNSADIIRYCNAKGYKTLKGLPFNRNSVSRILTNEKYCGVYRHSGIVLENGIPAIISKELFEKVNVMYKKNYSSRARGKAKIDYILSGKLYCGHCGGRMRASSGTSKTGKTHHYYKCATRMEKHTCDKSAERKERLENLVIETTVKQVLTDENIEMIATKSIELLEADAMNDTELNYYENELKETQKKISNIVDMIANGVANKSIADKLTELENYEKDVLTNLEFAKIKKPTLTKEQIIFWLETFKKGDINDIEYKKKIVNTLIHSVYVYDTDGKTRRIVLNFNTSANSQYEMECSITDSFTPPKNQYTNTLYVANYLMFSYMVEIESTR